MRKLNSNILDGWGFPLSIVMMVFLLWVGCWFLLNSEPERGTFGDMFGAVNALFSGLAFGGVIYAILLQRKELALQRHELELTREELKGQKEQLKNQNQTMIVQNFENTFFQMLKLHHEIVDSINRREFVGFKSRLKSNYLNLKVQNEQSRINMMYTKFFEDHNSDLGHYFRNLYRIIKFINEKGSEFFEEKYFYTSLVRAQLSNPELILLFYNCLSHYGCERFKPLIEEFHLLKNISPESLLHTSHKSLYDASAYKEKPWEEKLI